jgi:hypothetical protein
VPICATATSLRPIYYRMQEKDFLGSLGEK